MIKNDPLFDESLQAVLSHDGKDRCHESDDLVRERRKANQAPTEVKECMDAEWEQQNEDGNPIIDFITACIKPTILFGGLIAICIYWQNAELMAPAAAIPTMMVCAMLAGFYIGKQVRK